MSQLDYVLPYVYRFRYLLITNFNLLTQLLLDPTHPHITNIISLTPAIQKEIERISTDWCFKLHLVRAQFLNINILRR